MVTKSQEPRAKSQEPRAKSQEPRAKNKNFNAAREAREDEYYTQLPDIERELDHYKSHFLGKTVYCNCDDPLVSAFFAFFSMQFEEYGIKRLITTCYKSHNPNLFSEGGAQHGWKLVYEGDKNQNSIPDDGEIVRTALAGDGDFRSKECVELLNQADIVVTNPPFSLFRDYVQQLITHGKQFLIVGPKSAITAKEIFPLIRDGKLWLGNGFMAGNAYFKTTHEKKFADGVYNHATGLVKFRNVGWFTNMDFKARHEDLILYKKYTPEAYPTYANMDAIEVGTTKDIPADYFGPMGVPITFLDRHNPNQFEILGSSQSMGIPISQVAAKGSYSPGGPRFYLKKSDGTYRRMFERLVIKRLR